MKKTLAESQIVKMLALLLSQVKSGLRLWPAHLTRCIALRVFSSPLSIPWQGYRIRAVWSEKIIAKK